MVAPPPPQGMGRPAAVPATPQVKSRLQRMQQQQELEQPLSLEDLDDL